MEELTERQTDRQDRKDRDKRQDTRQNKTDSSSKTADNKTDRGRRADTQWRMGTQTYCTVRKGEGEGWGLLEKGKEEEGISGG